MRVSYTTPNQVSDVLARLGRTEDLRFSPSKRRLAVAGFAANKIVVFDIRRDSSAGSPTINLPSALEFSSTDLANPHGLDFIDEDRLVVANRIGRITIFELPAADDTASRQLAPIGVIPGELISSPGSVALGAKLGDQYEVLICNNSSHTVTKHIADIGGGQDRASVLLRKWLDIPDGISVSAEGRIAISNHNSHSVLIYENGRRLDENSDPDGITRGAFYPHGVRFTHDDQFLLVADAGTPYLHVYAKNGGWGGVHQPRFSLKVLSDADFLRGRNNSQEGGPKGLDIDEAGMLVATTCETQPLAFFDLAAILDSARRNGQGTSDASVEPADGRGRDHQSASQVMFELELQHACNETRRKAEGRATQAQAELDEARTQLHYMMRSKSWRLTAPMRSIFAGLKGCAAWLTGRA